MNVLIIDDCEIVRSQFKDLLTRAKMKVFELPSGIGATRVILQNDIQAAVIDVTMPGLSGDKLVGVLRGNRRLKDLIIVIISGRTWAELNSLSESVDANAFLTKERAMDELVPLIHKLSRTKSKASKEGAPASIESPPRR